MPAKIGRPSKSDDVSGDVDHVRKRSRTDPKCKSCAFQCENPTEGKLHKLMTWAKCLLTLKRGLDDRIRTSLSLLQEPGDAALVSQRLFTEG